jgi:hypothetical protein
MSEKEEKNCLSTMSHECTVVPTLSGTFIYFIYINPFFISTLHTPIRTSYHELPVLVHSLFHL